MLDNEKNKERIVFLDYLRIIATVSVAIGHLFNHFFDVWSQNLSFNLFIRKIIYFIQYFSIGGASGVVLFFLISGYIITHVLTKEDKVEFLVKRFFRIYPLYIFCVVLWFIFNKNYNFISTDFLITISLLGDFFSHDFSLSGVEWTLRIEIVFYIFMTVVFFIKNKTALIFSMVLFVFILFFFSPITSGKNGFAISYISTYFPFLVLGSIFYLYEKKHINFYIFLGFSFFLFYIHYSLIEKFNPGWRHLHYAIFSSLLFFFFSKLNFKENKIVRIIADLSYSLYLTHNWLFLYIDSYLNNYALSILILILICYLMHVFVETQGIKYGRYVLKKI
jgi:peptidoglycan/LPS O-acetylase OafA/YrhL